MPHDPAPHYPGLRPLGTINWMKQRHYYLGADGVVWCLETPHGGYHPPRWSAVAPGDLGRTRIDGVSLAELVAEARGTADTKEVPVVKAARGPAAGE